MKKPNIFKIKNRRFAHLVQELTVITSHHQQALIVQLFKSSSLILSNLFLREIKHKRIRQEKVKKEVILDSCFKINKVVLKHSNQEAKQEEFVILIEYSSIYTALLKPEKKKVKTATEKPRNQKSKIQQKSVLLFQISAKHLK